MDFETLLDCIWNTRELTSLYYKLFPNTVINANRSKADPQESEEVLVKDDPVTLNVRWVLISSSSNLTKTVESTPSQRKKDDNKFQIIHKLR